MFLICWPTSDILYMQNLTGLVHTGMYSLVLPKSTGAQLYSKAIQ